MTHGTKVTDPAMIATILAYCRRHNHWCHVTHTPPESKIGGFSARLLSIGTESARIKIANGDEVDVPTNEIHIDTSAW